MTHDELNALCAEHVAGWKRLPLNPAGMWGHDIHWESPQGTTGNYDFFPDYVNDANAVIALLEKKGMVEINKMHRMNVGWQWEVKVWEDGKGYFPKGEAEAPTFAEAGVRALLKAHGCEVGE